MTKFFGKLFAVFSLFLATAGTALAECTLNGQVVPCEDIPTWIFLIPLIMFLIGILFFVFWVWMLIDAIQNQKEDRPLWILILIFLNILGAIIYYFAEKRKRSGK